MKYISTIIWGGEGECILAPQTGLAQELQAPHGVFSREAQKIGFCRNECEVFAFESEDEFRHYDRRYRLLAATGGQVDINVEPVGEPVDDDGRDGVLFVNGFHTRYHYLVRRDGRIVHGSIAEFARWGTPATPARMDQVLFGSTGNRVGLYPFADAE
jgi:hypothetical protein